MSKKTKINTRNFIEKSLIEGEHGARRRTMVHTPKSNKIVLTQEMGLFCSNCFTNDYFLDENNFFIPTCNHCGKIMQEL